MFFILQTSDYIIYVTYFGNKLNKQVHNKTISVLVKQNHHYTQQTMIFLRIARN